MNNPYDFDRFAEEARISFDLNPSDPGQWAGLAILLLALGWRLWDKHRESRPWARWWQIVADWATALALPVGFAFLAWTLWVSGGIDPFWSIVLAAIAATAVCYFARHAFFRYVEGRATIVQTLFRYSFDEDLCDCRSAEGRHAEIPVPRGQAKAGTQIAVLYREWMVTGRRDPVPEFLRVVAGPSPASQSA